MLKIGIMAYENCLQSGIAGMLDLFTLSNWERRRQKSGDKSPFCRCDIITQDGEPVSSFNRQPIKATRSFADCDDLDLLIIPGIMGKPELLFEQKPLVKWVKEQASAGGCRRQCLQWRLSAGGNRCAEKTACDDPLAAG